MDVEENINNLMNDDPFIRIKAAENLGKSGNTIVIKPLIDSLNDDDHNVRYCKIRALTSFNDSRVSQVLIQHLKDSQWYIRSLCAIKLEKYLLDTNESALELLFQNEINIYSKINCALSLIILGKDTEKKYLEFILDLLNDDNIQVRSYVITILKDIDDNNVVDKLIHIFNEQDDQLKGLIIISLSHYQSEQVEVFFKTILNHPNPDIREKIVQGLEKFTSNKSLDYLIEFLKDENDLVRLRAVIALGNRGNDKAIPSLIENLKDSDQNIVYYTQKALNKIGF